MAKTQYKLKDEPYHYKLYVKYGGNVNQMVEAERANLELKTYRGLVKAETTHQWKDRYIKQLQETNTKLVEKMSEDVAQWKADEIKNLKSLIRVASATSIPNWDTETESFEYRNMPPGTTWAQTCKAWNDASNQILKLLGEEVKVHHIHTVIEAKADIIMGIFIEEIDGLYKSKDLPMSGCQKLAFNVKRRISKDVLELDKGIEV